MLVDDDAVTDVESGCFGQTDIRCDADTDHDRARRNRRSVSEHDAGHCAVLADDLRHLDAEPHVDAVTCVEVREQSRHLRTQDAQQRQLAHLQDSHVETGAAGGRGGLQADPPCADDRHRRTTLERGTKSVAVADSAQVVNPFEVSAGDVEVPWRRTGGE